MRLNSTNQILKLAICCLVAVFAIGMTQTAYGQRVGTGIFELENSANAETDHSGTALPDDWDRVVFSFDPTLIRSDYTPPFPPVEPSHADISTFVTDGANLSIFTGGGSKDFENINQWQWTDGSVPDKDDLLHGYAAQYVSGGSTYLFFGTDRYAHNGDSQLGFWFFKNRITLNPNGSFNGLHAPGDILLLSDFSGGGAHPTIRFYEWTAGDTIALVTPFDTTDAYASVCSLSTPSPWLYHPKSGADNIFAQGEFYEGGVNLTRLGLDTLCFSSFLAETRSSAVITAVLKDFILENFPTIPEVYLSPDTACAGSAGTICPDSIIGGIGTLAYHWDGPGGFSSDQECIHPTVPGAYILTATGSNGQCSGTDTTTFANYPSPSCNITGDNEICTGFTTQFCATAGMTSYAWTGPDDFTAATQCITIGTAGDYQVIITNANGCADTCSRTLTVDQQPVCNITGDDEICTGFTTDFCATAGMTSYAWTGPDDFTAATQCITIGTAGDYQVIITDANGCADTCSRTLEVHDQPVCNITGDDEICTGFTTDFCATAGMTTYAWTGPDDFTAATQCITIGLAGDYQVIITDASGCADTCSRTLIVDQQPVCDITGDNEICTGFTTDFCATAGMTSYAWTGPDDFTAATQCITIGVAGDYQVIITDANGCADTCSRTLIVDEQPVCNITGENSICTGFTTDFCATAGMTSYAWTGPDDFTAATQCITIGVAGDYQVIITDANGCADTCSRTLEVHDQPVCDITGDDEICTGFTTDFCATAGMTTYAWTGPDDFTAATQCITIGVAGDYQVIITDASGCADTCSRTLIVDEQPVCNITGDDEICTGFTTDFCATAGMTSYAWTGPDDFTAATQCITIGVAGDYQVIITDANGCADTCSRTLIVDEQPVCNITGENSICTGFTTDFCATAGMTSYAWTGPDDFTASTQCITIGVAGDYQVIITDANGCADTCSRTLEVHDQPVCDITGDDEICTGFTTDFCATAGMTTYAWTGPDDFTASTQCITIGIAGDYQVIITDASGCADTCSRTLIVDEQPVCNITGDDEICTGFTTDFCATAGMTSYAWTGPDDFTAATQCITIGVAGDYQVIITDANGCADTCSRTLTVDEQPVCNITGENSICTGFTTDFCATAGMTSYAWTGPDDFTASTQCITIGVAGDYQVIITDANGCADTCSRTLEVHDQPVCDITGDDEICTGFTTDFCATAGMTTYAWTGPDDFTAATQCITIGIAGDYQVIITDASGCADTCSRTLIVDEQPVCNITGDDEICTGFTTDFCATAGMTSYAWTGPDDFTAATQCITIGVAGDYQVIITDANGCADTCSRTLTVDEQPVCNITGENSICTGFTTDFCATAGMTSYAWTGPDDFTAATQCITIGVAGDYQVIITDANGCADTCSRTLEVHDQPVCDITGDDEICTGFTTDFCATAGMTTYAWTGPDDFTAATQCITIGLAGDYQVIITDASGCADTCSRTLTVDQQPVCNITGDDDICTGFTTDFCATAGMTSYAWTGPDDFTAATQCITIGVAGDYQVIITDANGCADTCSRTLTVDEQPVCNITGDNEICTGFTTEFCATEGMTSYAWTGPDDFTADTRCITIEVAGDYQVIITDANGCADTCSRTLTVHDQPACDISGDQEICEGFTTDFCGPDVEGMTYLWNGPEADGAITRCITISTAGTYFLHLTDANGCTSSCSQELTVDHAECSVSPSDTTICQGTTATFCANEGMQFYAWTGPFGFESEDRCITVDSAGTYVVVVTDINGCMDTCQATLEVISCGGPEHCSLTQGAYGNLNGQYNGMNRLQLIQSLLASGPLVVGKPGRSLTIPLSAAECIIARLPAVSSAKVLPNFGDQVLADSPSCQVPTIPTLQLPLQNGKFKNVLLGQVIALSLNMRLGCELGSFELCPEIETRDAEFGDDGIPCTDDDFINPDTTVHNEINNVPQSVLDALTTLGLTGDANGLLELANRALAGQNTGGARIGDINMAVDAVNEAFDECAFVVYCGPERSALSLMSANDQTAPQTDALVPAEYFLNQCYPNPFNATTKIDYGLSADAYVEISVYDLLGRKIATLTSEEQEAGYHQVVWNAGSVPSGVYFYRIVAGSFTDTKKMILMK